MDIGWDMQPLGADLASVSGDGARAVTGFALDAGDRPCVVAGALPMDAREIYISAITVPARLRRLRDDDVAMLMESIAESPSRYLGSRATMRPLVSSSFWSRVTTA